MKKRLVLIPIVLAAFSISPASAGRITSTNVACWFFRGEALGTSPGCVYESYSWAGGGVSTLQRWDKTAKATIAWGLQGRGERPCQDISLNGVCGSRYFRDAATLKGISDTEGRSLRTSNQKVVECVQTPHNSVCWLRHSSLD